MAEKEYIERGTALKSLRYYYGCSAECDMDCPVTECGEGRIVMKIPAADVVEVRHARWEINCDGYYPYCTNCAYEPPRVSGKDMRTLYCPNCGVKMDGGNPNEKL